MNYQRAIDTFREKLEDMRQELLYAKHNDVSEFNKLCRSLDLLYSSVTKFTMENSLEVLKLMYEQAQEKIGYKFPEFDEDCIDNYKCYSKLFTASDEHIVTIHILLYADCAVDLTQVIYDSSVMPETIRELELLMPRGVHPFALTFSVEDDEATITSEDETTVSKGEKNINENATTVNEDETTVDGNATAINESPVSDQPIIITVHIKNKGRDTARSMKLVKGKGMDIIDMICDEME